MKISRAHKPNPIHAGDLARNANVAKALWDGRQRGDGLGQEILLDGYLMGT